MVLSLRNTLIVSMSALALASPAAAQLVSLRTAPVSVSEQFYTFPSRLLGMGGGLALKDLEADPFSNPATGARIEGSLFTATPSLYTMPRDDGFGRTLAIAAFGGSATTFGALSVATQELESARQQNVWWQWDQPTSVSRNNRFSHNVYTFGLIGHRWAEKRTAVAVSASYAKLDALHTVDLLYPQAESIEQGGNISDVRVGYLRELEGERYFEAVLVRNHVDMEHTVTYVDRTWDPVTFRFTQSPPREEFNEDETTTWGAHIKYSRPMPESKWRLAGAFTVNAKDHPHIPNYDFMRIPRDPGNSWALRFALGLARADTVSMLALDLSYEPAWTYTWAEAATPITSASGKPIPRGGITVENDMVFSNTNMHVGFSRNLDRTFAVQAGLGIRRINYWLDQYSHITEIDREQDEGWTEITPSWGATFSFSDFQLRYFGHRRGGSMDFGGRAVEMSEPLMDGSVDIVAAPSGPLGMGVVPVVIHQIGISVPFGARRTSTAVKAPQ